MAVTTSMIVSLTRPACSEPPPIPTSKSVLARGSDPAIQLPKEITTAPPRARRKTRTKPDLHAGLKAGAWKVERELGKGGMASVYAVVHSRFGKRAALKIAHRSIIGPAFTSDTFLREARIVNLVNHPGVTDVFATGTYDGCPYLVMERLTGQTLGDRLDQGPMDRAAALDILVELCDVLSAAHKAGVVHRDLKLDNIFVLETPCSGGRTVKLLDWGVAAILGEPDPMAGMIAGTLTYVAPEQVRGDDLTPAADVYSLAVLAYQMLFGQPPFAAQKDLELIQKHLRATPPAPSSLWAEIPADLESLLLGMLAKQPEDRPTLDEVTQVLSSVRTALAAPVKVTVQKPSWFQLAVLPTRPPIDVLGRAAVVMPTGLPHKLLGAALALAVAAASLSALI